MYKKYFHHLFQFKTNLADNIADFVEIKVKKKKLAKEVKNAVVEITSKKVIEIIKRLREKKSLGFDRISNKVLKYSQVIL